MNTTTKPGVLAVIDARLHALNKFSAHTNEEAEEIEALTEARATVERLAEALDGMLKDGTAAQRCGHPYTCVCAGDEARAALAAFRGGM